MAVCPCECVSFQSVKRKESRGQVVCRGRKTCQRKGRAGKYVGGPSRRVYQWQAVDCGAREEVLGAAVLGRRGRAKVPVKGPEKSLLAARCKRTGPRLACLGNLKEIQVNSSYVVFSLGFRCSLLETVVILGAVVTRFISGSTNHTRWHDAKHISRYDNPFTWQRK